MSDASVSRRKSTCERPQGAQESHSFDHRAAKSMLFTPNDLHRCLYRRNQVILVSKEELRYSFQDEKEVNSYWCKACKQERSEQCKIHGPHQTFRMTRKIDNNDANSNNLQRTNAVQSFPHEVGLCISGIPGAGYGVCARQPIPLGTWIGPYEGEIVRPEQVTLGTDASYMWEIYHEGKLLYYIDGQDENKSSWMRFIRCARYGSEQNMFAFQYSGNIYYRAFKDIPAGTELLVWYDENYPQYMGIPLEIRETCTGVTSGLKKHAVPRENYPPGPRYGYSTSPRPLTDNFQHIRHLTHVRSAASTNGASALSHVRRRSHRRAEKTESLPTSEQADSHSQVQQESRPHDNSRPSTRPNAQKRVPYSLKDAYLLPENQVLSLGTTGKIAQYTKTIGHHDVRGSSPEDDSNVATPVAKEIQVRSVDEEGKSSDGSDASLFNCGQCGKSFAQQSVLQIHVCPKMPYKPYHCGHCSQSFDHQNDLRMHAVIHAAEKPFKCGYCSRSFAGATTLQNHVRTHTGEKPFTCERCGKTFTQASQLHRHEGIPGDCVPYNSHD